MKFFKLLIFGYCWTLIWVGVVVLPMIVASRMGTECLDLFPSVYSLLYFIGATFWFTMTCLIVPPLIMAFLGTWEDLFKGDHK